MKKSKKIILAIVAIVLVAVIAIGGSYIYNECFTLKAKIVSSAQPISLTLPKPYRGYIDFYNERSGGEYPFATQAWDMQVYDGKVFLAGGDYDKNSQATPVFTYNPKTEKFQYCDIVYTEQVGAFEVFDGRLMAVAIDPVAWGGGEYYVYNKKKNAFDYYTTLPTNIHCYDVEYFDGKYFFAGSVNDTINCSGVQWIDEKDICSTDKTKTHHSFLTVDGERIPEYLNMRVYELFAYKGELFAWHNALVPDEFKKYFGLFKYNKQTDCFEKLGDEYTMAPVEKKIQNEIDYMEIQAKLIYDDKYVFANNGLLYTEDFKNYTECEFGEGYEGFLAHDMFEREGQLYILASKKLKNGKHKTCVFVTEDLKEFAEVLNFESESYMISFEHIDNTFIFCEGSRDDNPTDNRGNLYAVKVE